MDREWLRKVLELARKLVSRGWIQGDFTRGEGQMQTWCMWGAIMEAARYDPRTEINHEEANVIEEMFKNHSIGKTSIIKFNDELGRTQMEVVVAFDAVIASLHPPAEPEPERLFQNVPAAEEPVPA